MCIFRRNIYTVCAHQALGPPGTEDGHQLCPRAPPKQPAGKPRKHCLDAEYLAVFHEGFCEQCKAHFAPHETQSLDFVLGYWTYKNGHNLWNPVPADRIDLDAVVGLQPSQTPHVSQPRCEVVALAGVVALGNGWEQFVTAGRGVKSRPFNTSLYLEALRIATLRWAEAGPKPASTPEQAASHQEPTKTKPQSRPIAQDPTLAYPMVDHEAAVVEQGDHGGPMQGVQGHDEDASDADSDSSAHKSPPPSPAVSVRALSPFTLSSLTAEEWVGTQFPSPFAKMQAARRNLSEDVDHYNSFEGFRLRSPRSLSTICEESENSRSSNSPSPFSPGPFDWRRDASSSKVMGERGLCRIAELSSKPSRIPQPSIMRKATPRRCDSKRQHKPISPFVGRAMTEKDDIPTNEFPSACMTVVYDAARQHPAFGSSWKSVSTVSMPKLAMPRPVPMHVAEQASLVRDGFGARPSVG